MSSSAASAQPVGVSIQAARNVQPAWIGHLLPLLMLLGSVTLPVLGKSFFLPLYLPFIYFGLLTRRIAISSWRVPRQDFYVGLYCLTALCSIGYVTDLPKYAYGAFSLFLIGIPAYALGRRLARSTHWRPDALIYAFVGAAALMSLLYLYKLAVDPVGFRVAFVYKLTSVAGMRSNTLVSFHIFGLVATLELLRNARRGRVQLLLLALLLIDIAGGIAFNSRIYMILMCVLFAIYLAGGSRRSTWYLRLLVVAIAVALIVRPPEGLVRTVIHRWTSHAAARQAGQVDPRLQIWQRSLEVWLERPLFGHGLTNSFLGASFLWRLVHDRATLAEIANMPEGVLNYRSDGYFMAHNTILQLLIEVGLVGATLFLILFARVVRHLNRLRRSDSPETRMLARVFLLALGLAFADGMIENNFLTRDFGALYWFVIGVSYSLYQVNVANAASANHSVPPVASPGPAPA